MSNNNSKPPPISHCGIEIEIEPYQVILKIPTLNLAMFAKSMRMVDSDHILDGIFRSHFELWRETLLVIVKTAFAKALLSDQLLSNLEEDIKEYLL